MEMGDWSALRWRGDDSLDAYAERALAFAVERFSAMQGLFYYRTGEGTLNAIAGYAADMRKVRASYAWGEGLPGQAARLGKTYWVDDPELITATGDGAMCRVPLRALAVAPAMYNDAAEGVIELAFAAGAALDSALNDYAAAVGAALNFHRMQAVRQSLYEQMLEKNALLEIREHGLKKTLEELELARVETERMSQELAESRARLSTLINSADDFIFHLDAQGVCTVGNEPFLKSLHPLDPVGRHFSSWAHDVQNLTEGLKIALLGRRHRFVYQAGDRHYEATLHPARDTRGTVVGAGVFVRDVTERLLKEREIRELNETLERRVAERTRELEFAMENLKSAQGQLLQAEKMAALGQLVAGVAHEINTPLGVVKGAAADLNSTLPDLLRDFPRFVIEELTLEYEPLFFEFVEKSMTDAVLLSSREERQWRRNLTEQLEELGIENAGDVARELVRLGLLENPAPFAPLFRHPHAEKILRVAGSLGWIKRHLHNIETAVGRTQKIVFSLKNYARKQNSGDKVEFDVLETIETVLVIHQNIFKKGVSLIKDFAPDLPLVQGYPDELTQVWTNIVHNALQAMKHEGELTVKAQRWKNGIRVSIADNGPGIPPEVMPRIFEPFFTTKPAGEGTGLGLDICRQIVEKHGGEIDVQSVPGNTVFHVYIPV
jgi:signal transduction histidine kinase